MSWAIGLDVHKDSIAAAAPPSETTLFGGAAHRPERTRECGVD